MTTNTPVILSGGRRGDRSRRICGCFSSLPVGKNSLEITRHDVDGPLTSDFSIVGPAMRRIVNVLSSRVREVLST